MTVQCQGLFPFCLAALGSRRGPCVAEPRTERGKKSLPNVEEIRIFFPWKGWDPFGARDVLPGDETAMLAARSGAPFGVLMGRQFG